MKQYRIIISGGGTGGHIFPAISIANTFRKRFPEAEILFVGADDRMEMEKVPAAGYRIVGLPVSGFDRAHLANNIRVAGRLLKSLKLAKKTIREFKPDIADFEKRLATFKIHQVCHIRLVCLGVCAGREKTQHIEFVAHNLLEEIFLRQNRHRDGA